MKLYIENDCIIRRGEYSERGKIKKGWQLTTPAGRVERGFRTLADAKHYAGQVETTIDFASLVRA